MTTDSRKAQWTGRCAASAAALIVLGLAACGGDTDTPAAPATTQAKAGATVAVKGIDYAFEGVPSSIKAGTKLTLSNSSAKELHELVAVRLPDTEKRSASELVKDPAALGGLMGGGPPAAVIIAAPTSSMPGPVVGDGTLTNPGRYLLVCAIPTGADPTAYMAAAQASQGGPPNVPGGPPHFTKGMVAETTVTA